MLKASSNHAQVYFSGLFGDEEVKYGSISKDCFGLRSSLLGAGGMAYLVKGFLC